MFAFHLLLGLPSSRFLSDCPSKLHVSVLTTCLSHVIILLHLITHTRWPVDYKLRCYLLKYGAGTAKKKTSLDQSVDSRLTVSSLDQSCQHYCVQNKPVDSITLCCSLKRASSCLAHISRALRFKTHTYACMYVRMETCMYLFIYLCMCVCMYVYMCICTYVCMYYVCTYVCMHACMPAGVCICV